MAIENGAQIINDISAFKFDRKILNVIKSSNCGYVLMHMKGTPKNMQVCPYYDDVVEEIFIFLKNKLEEIKNYGINEENVVVDPGIVCFGKTV